MLTGPEPGITRDAISVDWTWRDRRIRLVDTAGLRRRARVDDRLEKLSRADAIRAMELAEVVILLTEATAPLERQDLVIARQVLEEGRALVVALGKWDSIEDRGCRPAAGGRTVSPSHSPRRAGCRYARYRA